SSPSNKTVEWSKECLLFWTIQDSTPLRWEIFLNGSLVDTDLWETPIYNLSWFLPVLDEAKYNCTLVIYDKAAQYSNDSFWITVIPPSPPIIAETPEQTDFQYGVDEISLMWLVHGGKNYTIWKDGTIMYEGDVVNNTIIVTDSNWYPGEHNLTLTISDVEGNSITANCFIYIWINIGDKYVDEIVKHVSELYENGENVIGAPDGKYSNLVLGLTNGYLTLDMGYQESIIDGQGTDFTVIAGVGTYVIWISNDPLVPFTYIGIGSGNQSFDISETSFGQARYIRVEYVEGGIVELDAIVAINYQRPEWDDDPPVIISPGDFWIWENVTEITITWRASDQLPLNYSILINGEIVKSSSWNGSDIQYTIKILTNSTLNLTLILFDMMLQHAEDTITIEIHSLSDNIDGDNRPLTILLSSIFGTILVISTLYFSIQLLKKKGLKL
ncbi:MAG: hypothetical protein KAS95_04250, partial [Candidatus Heimdallarchaeota archaeon]|nr:hypothetical protein [Candidatus Heimdallarchaeota archaeon]